MLKNAHMALSDETNQLKQNESDENISFSKNSLYIKEFQMETIENLYKFKNENLFTDISIYIEGVEFPCHKVVLCAASVYFKTMFLCNLKESRLGKVYFENISPWTMKRLLDFIYTGKIEINFDNVIDLYNTACMFQLTKLENKCTSYIKEHIDLYNCVEINIFATQHNLVDLECDTLTFILENFMDLINLKTDTQTEENDIDVNYTDFSQLSERTFTELLKSDLLNVTREIYVYYALNKWIFYNKTNNYESLFKHVRLNALSKEELTYILGNDAHVKSNENLRTLVSDVLEKNYSSSTKATNKLQTECCMINTKKRNSLNSSETKYELLLQKNENFSLFMKNIQKSILSKPLINNYPCSYSNSTTCSYSCSSSSTSSSNGNDILAFSEMNLNNLCSLSNKANKSNLRPSTIPRNYMCWLCLDQFLFYDFYKSKWNICSKWQTCVNRQQTKQQEKLSYTSFNNLLNNEATLFSLNYPSSKFGTDSSPTSTLQLSPSNLSIEYLSQRLNGYSTCVVNNILYVIGGHLINNTNSTTALSNQNDLSQNFFNNSTNINTVSASSSDSTLSSSQSNEISPSSLTCSLQQIDLVDTVYRYDPSKNEWSTCKPMLKKRAFHLSVSLSDSCTVKNIMSKEKYIFIFYGLCFQDEPTTITSQTNSDNSSNSNNTSQDHFSIFNGNNPRLVQCNSIEFYNIETDTWSILTLDNSLLMHHLFQPYRIPNLQEEINQNEANDNLQMLNHFINFQLIQAKSIVSLKNLIYILRENCIHCYEFNSKTSNLICLPYFRLPIKEINTFVLSAAVPIKATQLSCESLFSWYEENDESDNDDNDNQSNDGQDLEENIMLKQRSFKKSQQDLIAEEKDSINYDSDSNSSEVNGRSLEKRKEALIYIISPTQGIIYEFYPAKNKLKKLPDLLLKHSSLETQVLNIKSKLYVTSGIQQDSIESEVNHMQIEVFDQETCAWSLFLNKVEDVSPFSSLTLELNSQRQVIPLINHYFKLKMPLV